MLHKDGSPTLDIGEEVHIGKTVGYATPTEEQNALQEEPGIREISGEPLWKSYLSIR
jgi:hypothetical protein